MENRADELKRQIADADNTIEAQKLLRKARMERVTLIDDYICQLEKRKLRLRAELEKEESVLIRPQGHAAQITDASGVKWTI